MATAEPKKYTYISRQNCSEVTALVNEALATLEQYGLSVKLGNVRYNESGFRGQLVAAVAKSDGIVRTPSQLDFERNCFAWGLKPTDLGKKFKWSKYTGFGTGELYTLVGANSRSYKYPLLVSRQYDGKIFKFPIPQTGKLSDYFCLPD